MGTIREKSDDEYSVITEKPEIGFLDYQDDMSMCSYNPAEEGPVRISVPFPFRKGKPQSIFAGEIAVDTVTINNTTTEAVSLWTKILSSNPENSFTLSVMEPPTENSDKKDSEGFLEFFDLEDRMVQPGEILTVWVTCKPKEIGMHSTVLSFEMDYDTIERAIFLLADDKISKSLMSQKPYSKGIKKKHFSTVDGYVTGSRPLKKTDNRPVKTKLPLYDIPRDMRDTIEGKQIPEIVFEGLTAQNYVPFFRVLLIMEEIQLEEDMRSHNMENVSMKRKGNFITLIVPGLAERRPSLVHGDYIFVKNVIEAGDLTSRPYQGYIHRVEADEIHLKFSEDFHAHYHWDRNLYNVQFTYNRINTRRLYQAAEAAQRLETEFLFPSECNVERVIETNPLVPISTLLNEEQMCSVEKILGCKGAPPYLIYGPPGTGKSMTLVEAIMQLYTTRKHAGILVCAPSNNAADYLLEKILSQPVRIHEDQIFRLHATTRSFDDVKPEILRFCSFDESTFRCPPLSALRHYKIIVSTYMSTSLLIAEGVKRGHFSHIFLDEAGQATEPESMIPIANLSLKKTVVVLAGDPMQLGPVIYSKNSENFGFGISYLERLYMSDNYYSSGNENYMTKLVRNYRCHPEILYLPSVLFYKGELIACKDHSNSFLNSMDFLPNREFPVLFHGIQGCDEREGSNPSWFNRIEASKVVETIQELMDGGNLTARDIGVIAPYRQQVLKIKKALDNLDLSDITVGSVEQFQGQERQVIIVSTVRSTVKHNDFDKAHCLGFLSNPKRFNVAITRAIALLVIIGNPHIIRKDNYWNKLLWRCVDNNSYKGCMLPERQDNVDEYPDYPLGEENQQYYEPPTSGGGEWDQDFSEPQPNGGGGEWNQQYSEPVQPNGGGGRDRDYSQPQPSGGGKEWDQEYLPDFPKPVTDESEWSDGWK